MAHTPIPDDRQTKDRLLDAAEDLFAARGFAEVSIRELALAADVNIAAVNYHFHGKENHIHIILQHIWV